MGAMTNEEVHVILRERIKQLQEEIHRLEVELREVLFLLIEVAE